MGNSLLVKMLRDLHAVDDMAWGRYAFSRDFLQGRVLPAQRDEMIRRAVACGTDWATRIQKETGANDPFAIARALELDVQEGEQPMTEKRALFAQFVPDNHIEIMQQPLENYATLYANEQDGEDAHLFPPPEQVKKLLLAHEIFHYVEETHAQEIYTRTETIRLWKFLWFENNSTLRAVGEIAAMQFAKALVGTSFSPFMLDVLLFFSYNEAGAESIYRDVMAAAGKNSG